MRFVASKPEYTHTHTHEMLSSYFDITPELCAPSLTSVLGSAGAASFTCRMCKDFRVVPRTHLLVAPVYNMCGIVHLFAT